MMPYSINGIGTNLCRARGITPWGDCDSVECLTFLYVPILPFRAVHTYEFGREQSASVDATSTAYRQIPIRWSMSLLLSAFLRRWLRSLAVAGGLMLFVSVFGWWDALTINDPETAKRGVASAWWMTGISLSMSIAALAFLGLLKRIDCRNVDIRYVLGCHTFGSSDPVHWPTDLLRSLPGPDIIFNAPTFAHAVEEALENGDWTGAMWAARLSTALEDNSSGEALTDRVLNHTHVQAALAAVKLNVERWSEQMTGGKGAVQLWPATQAEHVA